MLKFVKNLDLTKIKIFYPKLFDGINAISTKYLGNVWNFLRCLKFDK